MTNTHANENPRFFVKIDDDRAGTVTVYVEWLPEGFDDEGEGDHYAKFDYSRSGQWNRAQARTQAEGLAARWAHEINKRWPCEWGSNY